MILILLAALVPNGVFGQFGGAGGGGGYNPPAPICPMFTCPAGQKAVGKPDSKMWSYGCKESGMNVFNTASFDPNNPMGGMQGQKSVDKCCVERDICKQTCGMSSKACHDLFQKCSGKVCKGDQNCNLQAMISEMMSEPHDAEENKDKDDKYDPDKTKCKGYDRGQKSSCMCVPKDDFKDATEKTLKSFYGKYNKEKLDKSGEIKDVDEVWKKWKGKEPDMFLALGTKYKAKAVQIKEKPKPPPYTPPAKDDSSSDSASSDDYSSDYNSDVSQEEPSPAPQEAPASDPEDEVFAKKLKELIAQKKKAAADEDYDGADEAKEKVVTLKKEEAKRLNAQKKAAIADEDFVTAKKIKARIAEFEL